MSNFEYNAFTGNLDLVGSGASYIDGVVATPASLPTTVGTPALDSVYLAKAGSGVWLINRRPGGLYCRVANNGNANDWQHLGAFPEVNADGNWELYNSTDPTKELKFDLSGLPTATTRTVNAPDGNGKMLVNTQPVQSNNGTLTASAPVLDLEQTWNNAAVAFTGLRFNAVRTAASDSSTLLSLTVAGNNRFSVIDTTTGSPRLSFSSSGFSWEIRTRTAGGVGCNFTGIVGLGSRLEFLSSSTSTGAGDVVLVRDAAADTLALQRSTIPQTFRIYNTFTDASNYERGFMRWSSNVLQIGTEKAGTGSARALEFQTDGVTRYTIGTTGIFSSQNSRIVFDDTNTIAHFGNTPRFSVYYANNQYVAIGGGTGLRFASGRSDQASVANLELIRDADAVLAQRAGTNAQTFRIYNTVSGTNNVNFDRVNFRWASNEFIIDAEAGGTGTLRGIKIGSATSSLLGFFGVTPVDQPATVADPAGGGTIDTEARTAINALIDRLQELGLIA